MNVVLVQPEYRQAVRTKHPAKIAPVGLYKWYAYHEAKGDKVFFTEQNVMPDFKPDIIRITSLFTYWSEDVFKSIEIYSKEFPESKIIVGGIFASLMPEEIKRRYPFVDVVEGIVEDLEHCRVDWHKLGKGVQIIHASRSCIRKCAYCGVWKIEKKISFKSWPEVRDELQLNEVVFFDNNFLMNPHHEEILEGISKHKINGHFIQCECQSGFDPRLINKTNAVLLKKARFKSIRFSWDFGMEQKSVVKQALQHLLDAGFNSKNMGVFMIYNWDIPFKVLEMKRKTCKEWNIQIFDCRYRPLNQLYDNYDSHAKKQTIKDYFIHKNWTDKQIRQFRKNIREQNIVIRFNFENIQQYKTWVNENKKTGKLVNRQVHGGLK